MELEEIRKIIELMNENSLNEFQAWSQAPPGAG